MDIVAYFLPVSQCAICLYTFTPIHFLSITALGIGNESPVAPVFVGAWRRSLFVGYAQSTLQSGAKIVTPQFLGLTTQDGQIELQSIRCGEEDSDLVIINTLDSLGAVVKSYNWVTYGGPNGDEWCWLDADTMEKPEEPVYFAAGQALWVEGDSEDNIFQTSGKVSAADLDVTLQSGATMTGNFTPL